MTAQHSFAYIEVDIPAGLTIASYRAVQCITLRRTLNPKVCRFDSYTPHSRESGPNGRHAAAAFWLSSGPTRRPPALPPAAHGRQVAPNRETTGVEVDVRPAEPERLAAPKAGARDDPLRLGNAVAATVASVAHIRRLLTGSTRDPVGGHPRAASRRSPSTLPPDSAVFYGWGKRLKADFPPRLRPYGRGGTRVRSLRWTSPRSRLPTGAS